ncbi:MAG: DNA translocase FtsK [Muribaculum sp.]|nr:DNA translocase FtsK [Muribaculum sp.]
MRSSDTILTDHFDPDMLDPEYARRGYENSGNMDSQSTRTEQNTDQPKGTSSSKAHQAKTTKSQTEPGKAVKFLKDKRTRLFTGITLICWATYLTIAAISYFAYGADDQSLVMNKTVSEMSADSESVNNAGGAFGAFLAQNFISNGLGLGSFAIIFYFFALGIYLLHHKSFSFWGLTMKSLIVAVTTSVVAGLATYDFTSWIYWGGIHGYEINRFLIASTGVTGAILVSIILIALVVSIYLNELRIVYVAYRKRVNEYKAKVAAERAAKEAERQRIEESLRASTEAIEDLQQEREETATQPEETPELVGFSNEFIGGLDDYNSDEVLPIDDTDDHVAESDAEQIKDSEETVSPTTAITIIDSVENSADTESDESDQEEVELKVNIGEIEEAEEIATDVYDPTAELSKYHFPSIELLNDIPIKASSVDQTEMEENKNRITATLNNYQIPISHIEATVGPTVTLYEIIPAEGVRIAKIKRLEDDIALSLAALGIRIIAPIPGKGTIGIEVPNKEPQMVPIRSVIGSKKFQECTYDLPMAMGATISKDIFIADLAKMPHVLVAGATGQGKSVGLNTIIASLLYKKHPAELKFVLVDPKMVEFSLYSKLERHYLAKLPDEEEPIITDPTKVVATLNSLCIEMDNRYALLKEANVRSVKEYNAKFVQRRLNPEKGHRYLPYIVIVVDEFGDLIMTAGKEVETPIARIAQKARAVGMHMILATQRPSTNVITGIIKANFPGRIAFRVAQMVDSRTILDRPGANQLIGKGDMLYAINGEIERVQCAYISTEEVEAIVDDIDSQMGYDEAYPLPDYVPDNDGSAGGMSSVNDRDPLFEEAARFIITSNTASTSSLQRRYSIGYNRAGKIMDQMEAAGIVGPASGAKPRQVLIDSLQLERMLEL